MGQKSTPSFGEPQYIRDYLREQKRKLNKTVPTFVEHLVSLAHRQNLSLPLIHTHHWDHPTNVPRGFRSILPWSTISSNPRSFT